MEPIKTKNMEFDFNLLKEWSDYGIDKAIENKARRVMFLCMRNKKYKLATKIEQKYNLGKNDDMAMAFGLSLLAQQHVKRNGNQR